MLNLALRKPAFQSSVSRYSLGSTQAEDAKGGNNGNMVGRHIAGHFGFHTETERDPWWQVDLEDGFYIRRVAIFNRRDQPDRLKHFTVLGSKDGREWQELFCKSDDRVFGADGEPFEAEISGRDAMRFVRVRLDGHAPLHFNECQVFGEHPSLEVRVRMQRKEALAQEVRSYIPDGRRGRIIEVDGFSIFVDDDRYDKSIIAALERGNYENPERLLAGRLINHVDRVVDIGTGIGLVAMTAARITGGESVVTFDANPEIAGDAQENFKRNGLEGIKSHAGNMRNRQAITDPNETSTFFINREFWASRQDASATDHNIIKTVQVPIYCLEDVIRDHRATVLITDIEGAEVELLSRADLSSIRLIIMETHYWAAGEVPTDEMVRQLILSGFSIDLSVSHGSFLALRKHKSK